MDDWNDLARTLRKLHGVLLQRARDDYARAHGRGQEIGPGELLMVATRDESFAWLRSLSELMTDIDYLRDDADTRQDDKLRGAVRGAVESLLQPPVDGEPGGMFAQHYWPLVNADPEVTMAHAAARQALQGWPAAQGAGTSEIAERRGELSDKRRPA
jgi:hypothetical protein